MKRTLNAALQGAVILLVLCLTVTSALSENAALIDPQNGVLMDDAGLPMSYSSLLTLLGAGAAGTPNPRTLIDYGTPLTLSDFLPDTGTVSDWQIVSRSYESAWEITDEIARRKSVSPTGKENEFEIVLEVCAPMSWEEFLKSQVYRQSQNVNPFHSKSGEVFFADSQPAGENVNKHGPAIIKLGNKTLFTTQWWLQSGMSGTGWMYFVGPEVPSPISFYKGQFTNGETVEFDIAPLAAVFQQSENEVRAFCVADPVPDPLIAGDPIYSADGTVNDGTPWHWHSVEYRSIPGLYGGKPSYMRIYTYSYKVTLDTTHRDFVPDTPYYTNGTTTLEYTFNDAHRYIDFAIPQVKGKHYSVDIYKSNVENPDEGLKGAEFKLFHADGTPFIPNGGTEQVTYETDEDGWLKISGISCGEYYLQETKAPKGYILPEGNGAKSGIFTLSYAALSNNEFTYRYDISNTPVPTGDLIISKTVTGGGDESQSFLFHVICQCPDNQTMTFDLDLHGGESKTIKEIPAPFEYTVTEDTAWSWRYTCDGTTKTGNVPAGETGTAAFTNDYSENHWEGDTVDQRNEFDCYE